MTPSRPPHQRHDPEPAAPPTARDAPQNFPTHEHSPDGSAAFDELVTANYARLCSFVYRYVRSHAAAEDVVQDVFARIWERGGRLDCRDPVQYLFRAARNRAISHLRHERAVGRLETNIANRASAPSPATDELEYDELSAAIGQAIAALPERCRLVYTLSRDQGLTYAEIARVLGISVKTVEVQMYRAFKALRRKVAPYLVLMLMVRVLPL